MRDCDFVRAKTADISRNTPDPQEQQQQVTIIVLSLIGNLIVVCSC